MMMARLQASGELEAALQQQQQQERLRMQQQDARMREQAAAMPPAAPQQPSFISPQMESYAAGPAAPREQGIPGARGLPFLSEMPMNDFNNLRLQFANIPASRRQPGMQEAIEAEARRRVEQLRAEVTRLDQSNGMRDMRQSAWQNANQRMPQTQGPQMPPSIPGNPANPMPQGQPMAGVPLDPYGPAQLQGWEDRAMAGQMNPPQMDPVAALIQALRSGGGQNGQSTNPMLMRLLQGS
jgi:hypothetical protein